MFSLFNKDESLTYVAFGRGAKAGWGADRMTRQIEISILLLLLLFRHTYEKLDPFHIQGKQKHFQMKL